MTKATQAVLADALRLDLDARAEIAAELLGSLDGPPDSDTETAWAAEIERLSPQLREGRSSSNLGGMTSAGSKKRSSGGDRSHQRTGLCRVPRGGPLV